MAPSVAENGNDLSTDVMASINSRKLYSAKTVTNSGKCSTADIIDIRSGQSHFQTTLKNEILQMLQPNQGPKAMPTLLLYDGRGLQLFEEVPESPKPLYFKY